MRSPAAAFWLLGKDEAPPRQERPAKAAVARKILIAAWHVLARQEAFRASAAAAARAA